MRQQGSTEQSQVVTFRQDIRRLLEGKIVVSPRRSTSRSTRRGQGRLVIREGFS